MISLIIPMYNNEATIATTLQSVVNQSVAFTEVLVVDNGSSDKSVAIVSALCQQYSWIHLLHCDLRGVAAARNMGIDSAQTRYIGFLDADDVLESNYVEVLSQSILEYPEADMHHFNFYQQFKSGIIKQNPYFLHDQVVYDGQTFKEETLKRFSFEAKHMVWTFIFKKAFLDQYNLRFNQETTIFEDILFLHEVWEKCAQLIVVNDELIRYSWNQFSITNSNNEQRLIENLSLLYQQLQDSSVAVSYLVKLTSRLLSFRNYRVFWQQNANTNSLVISGRFITDKIKYVFMRMKRKIANKK